MKVTVLPLALLGWIRTTATAKAHTTAEAYRTGPPIANTKIFVYPQKGLEMGFSETKKKVIACLLSGEFAHEGRTNIHVKNLLQMGKVSAQEVAEVLKKSRGCDHAQRPHHQDASIDVHVITCRDWYVKFYFDPNAVFISVHQ